jgi:hypothetical protein
MKTAVLALISSVSLARKRLVDAKDRTLEQAPRVEECEEKCFFKNDNNSWCLSVATPVLQIGWTYEQNFDIFEDEDTGAEMNYFTLKLLTYAQGYLDINSIYDIKNLYYNDFNVLFPKTKFEYSWMLTFNGDGQICPGMGWSHDAIDLSLSMTSHFDQCSKVIIDQLGAWTSWKGDDAKWFQECEDSEDVEMDLTTWNFEESRQNNIIYGTQYPASVMHCYDFPGEIFPFSLIFNNQGPNGASLKSYEQTILNNFAKYLAMYLKPASKEFTLL